MGTRKHSSRSGRRGRGKSRKSILNLTDIEVLFLLFYNNCFLGHACSSQDLNSPTRDWTHTPLQWKHPWVLTTGLPGNSLKSYFNWHFFATEYFSALSVNHFFVSLWVYVCLWLCILFILLLIHLLGSWWFLMKLYEFFKYQRHLEFFLFWNNSKLKKKFQIEFLKKIATFFFFFLNSVELLQMLPQVQSIFSF